MLGFRNRKKFNGNVDQLLTSKYKIVTRDNPRFPGVLAYLEMLDQAWNAKFTDDEAAMFVATLYYSGLMKNGFYDEAGALEGRLENIGASGFATGKIGMQRLGSFRDHIKKANEHKPEKITGADEGVGLATFIGALRVAQEAGFNSFEIKFWSWLESDLGGEVAEICFGMYDLIRTKVLFKDEAEMNELSFAYIERVAVDLYMIETKCSI
ncbi:hypothetical protein [Pseudomonas aeruginosa]|uniref:hypothetical protein n=1 Tax=Pseudomonas aeruginosa TaxID=287 RepID=UPI0015C2EB31|nr:hypothetical protein [Pseudomonas aeruginosa]QLF20638.1 hypothetical protein GNT46_08680 [Pseudomonas aeruginosa]